MSFFDAIGKLGKATLGVALLPLDAAKDLVTLGGAIIDDESAIVKRARKIAENASEAYEEIDE